MNNEKITFLTLAQDSETTLDSEKNPIKLIEIFAGVISEMFLACQSDEEGTPLEVIGNGFELEREIKLLFLDVAVEYLEAFVPLIKYYQWHLETEEETDIFCQWQKLLSDEDMRLTAYRILVHMQSQLISTFLKTIDRVIDEKTEKEEKSSD